MENEDAPQDHLLDDGMDGVNVDGGNSPDQRVSRLDKPGGSASPNKNDIFAEGFRIELPYHIEIMSIPRLSEVKSIWH